MNVQVFRDFFFFIEKIDIGKVTRILLKPISRHTLVKIMSAYF